MRVSLLRHYRTRKSHTCKQQKTKEKKKKKKALNISNLAVLSECGPPYPAFSSSMPMIANRIGLPWILATPLPIMRKMPGLKPILKHQKPPPGVTNILNVHTLHRSPLLRGRFLNAWGDTEGEWRNAGVPGA
jgi:hypothetical protein